MTFTQDQQDNGSTASFQPDRTSFNTGAQDPTGNSQGTASSGSKFDGSSVHTGRPAHGSPEMAQATYQAVFEDARRKEAQRVQDLSVAPNEKNFDAQTMEAIIITKLLGTFPMSVEEDIEIGQSLQAPPIFYKYALGEAPLAVNKEYDAILHRSLEISRAKIQKEGGGEADDLPAGWFEELITATHAAKHLSGYSEIMLKRIFTMIKAYQPTGVTDDGASTTASLQSDK